MHILSLVVNTRLGLAQVLELQVNGKGAGGLLAMNCRWYQAAVLSWVHTIAFPLHPGSRGAAGLQGAHGSHQALHCAGCSVAQRCGFTYEHSAVTACTSCMTPALHPCGAGTPCPQELSSLVLLVNRDLTPSVYSVIQDTQSVRAQGTALRQGSGHDRVAPTDCH